MSISRWMDNGQSLNSPVFYFAWSSLMLKHFSGFCLSLIIVFSSMICFVLFNIYLCSVSPFVHALCSWPQWAPFWKLFSILFQVYISDYYFSLEKEMATHCNIIAWRIPWTEKPGGIQSMGSERVGHNWVTNTNTLLLFFRVSIWRFISFLLGGTFLPDWFSLTLCVAACILDKVDASPSLHELVFYRRRPPPINLDRDSLAHSNFLPSQEEAGSCGFCPLLCDEQWVGYMMSTSPRCCNHFPPVA